MGAIHVENPTPVSPDRVRALLDVRPLRARSFGERVSFTANGCWAWTGSLDNDGRPKFIQSMAYRWAYEFAVGPVADDLEIDHLCNNRICVNPEHLEPVTRPENARRRSERQLYCGRGHTRTPENMYRWNGQDACRPCQRIVSAKSKRRRSGGSPAITRVQPRWVRHAAESAIVERHGASCPDAILSCELQPLRRGAGSVNLRVNSIENGLTVEAELRARGYAVEWGIQIGAGAMLLVGAASS